MRFLRITRRTAFAVSSVLFVACAADSGDISKVGQPATVTQTPGSSSSDVGSTNTSSTSSPSDTDTQTDSNTGASTSSEPGTTTGSTSTGVSGTDDGGDDEAEAAAPCTTCEVELEYEFSNTTGSDQFSIEIINNGTTAIDLSQVTAQYYFATGGTTSWAYSCDSAMIQVPAYVNVQPDVTGTFVASTASASDASEYLNIAFSADAPMLQPGASVTVQNRFNDPSYTLDQANDYSYDANGSTFVDNMKIPVYVGGALVWGVPPQ